MKPFKPIQTRTVGYPLCSQLSRLFLVLVMRSLSLRPLLLFMILICYSFLFQFIHQLSLTQIAFVHTSNSGPSLTLSNFLLHVLNEYSSFSLTMFPLISTLSALSLSVAQCCSGPERPCFALKTFVCKVVSLLLGL